MTSPSHLHLWVPGLQPDSGGIDTYSCFFLRALNDIYPSAGKHIFIKHDPTTPSEPDGGANLRFHTAGTFPLRLRTPVFAAQGLSYGALERPGIIFSTHANFTRALRHLKTVRNIPYIAVLHGVEAWGIESQSLIKGLRGASRLLSVSRFTKDKVVTDTGIDESKIGVVPNTFEHERFHVAPKPEHLLEKYGLKPDQPVILTVARLSKAEQYKGHDVIIQALPRIQREIPDSHYLIVGKGDDQERLENLVRSKGLEAHVTFAGFVPDDDLCAHYNLCDIFAMPSTGEGFGIVFLEAMGCGKPVIAGNKDASVEAVDHGNLGAVVNPTDPAEVATAAIGIFRREHPNKLILNPDALRAKVIDLFAYDRFKAHLERELNLVLQPD